MAGSYAKYSGFGGGGGSGGVTSLNGETGALTLVGGTGITITPSGQDITISATGSVPAPGGATGDIQYNNAGVFGGDPNFTTDGAGNLNATTLVTTGNITASTFYTTGDNISIGDNSGNYFFDNSGNLSSYTIVNNYTFSTDGGQITTNGGGSLQWPSTGANISSGSGSFNFITQTSFDFSDLVGSDNIFMVPSNVGASSGLIYDSGNNFSLHGNGDLFLGSSFQQTTIQPSNASTSNPIFYFSEGQINGDGSASFGSGSPLSWDNTGDLTAANLISNGTVTSEGGSGAELTSSSGFIGVQGMITSGGNNGMYLYDTNNYIDASDNLTIEGLITSNTGFLVGNFSVDSSGNVIIGGSSTLTVEQYNLPSGGIISDGGSGDIEITASTTFINGSLVIDDSGTFSADSGAFFSDGLGDVTAVSFTGNLNLGSSGTITDNASSTGGSGQILSAGTGGQVVWINGPPSTAASAFGLTDTNNVFWGTTAFTAHSPLLTGSTGTLVTGSLSGNTTKLATVSGSLTTNNYAAFDASGNIIDSGVPEGTSNSAGYLDGTQGVFTTSNGSAPFYIYFNGTGNPGLYYNSSNQLYIQTAFGTTMHWDTSGNTFLAGALQVAGAFTSDGGSISSSGTGSLTITGTLQSNALTANRPVYSNSSKVLTSGTFSGNTTEFATVSGSLTSGHIAKFDASGNIVDGGAAPTGTVTTVSVVSANGFSGSVANPTTTPAITLSYSPTYKAPTVQSFTSGSGTYTTPTSPAPLYIKVRMIGAGGGGGGTSGSSVVSGSNGGSTTFGSWSAGGGGGASASNTTPAPGGGGTNSTSTGTLLISAAGGDGDTGEAILSVSGGTGGTGVLGGAGAGGFPGNGGANGKANTGGGGGGAGYVNPGGSQAGGGSGGYLEFIPAASATFAYAIGAGGAGGTGTAAGGTGGSGYILVEEFYQ